MNTLNHDTLLNIFTKLNILDSYSLALTFKLASDLFNFNHTLWYQLLYRSFEHNAILKLTNYTYRHSFVKLHKLTLLINTLKINADLYTFIDCVELNLSYKQISYIPNTFGLLTNLQILHLDNNQLGSLPDSFGLLTNLQTLYLNYNRLTYLPDSIKLLTNLRELSLGCNRLTSLPDSIGLLTNLQELYLDNNQLKCFNSLLLLKNAPDQ